MARCVEVLSRAVQMEATRHGRVLTHGVMMMIMMMFITAIKVFIIIVIFVNNSSYKK